ncbi:hypothetical protein [Sulfitobacter sp. R18_1]|uniref:hypothetical protein n=1 Tax=Sulfitobacter sp. R18_1 TaxID=2821104 RepID=UPI001ADA6D45|nr:hypothetical protein [Sulfitobacter sp. R18_1]MBO9428292.1 hypothetical protein [Sulfitobacter sp. R18_1]
MSAEYVSENEESHLSFKDMVPSQDEVDNEMNVAQKIFSLTALSAAVYYGGPALYDFGVKASHKAIMMSEAGHKLSDLNNASLTNLWQHADVIEMVANGVAGGAALTAGLAGGVLAYKTAKPYVISLGKDIMKAFDKASKFLQGDRAEGVPKSYAKKVNNAHAVLRLMDQKGEESFLVGRTGEKSRVVGREGMENFVKSLGDEPCMYVGKADGEIVVSTIKHDEISNASQLGHLIVTSEDRFARDLDNYTKAIVAQYESKVGRDAEPQAPSQARL